MYLYRKQLSLFLRPIITFKVLDRFALHFDRVRNLCSIYKMFVGKSDQICSLIG